MAKELTDILLAAIEANPELVAVTGGRVYDTANEVPPFTDDNTPTPFFVVTDRGTRNEQGSKDYLWEGDIDHCSASIIICGKTPSEVRRLRRKVRKAVEDYIVGMANKGEEIPTLTASSTEGVAWDDLKPCYNDAITYQCDMEVLSEDNNE